MEDFDIYQDEDLYEEEETEVLAEDEGSNRTFIIAMIGMGAALLGILCIGVVYMFIIAPRNGQDEREAIIQTNEAILAQAGVTETVAFTETPTPTDAPEIEATEESDTATLEPTPTEEPEPTPTPTVESADVDEDADEDVDENGDEEAVTATAAAIAEAEIETPAASPTPRVTPTRPADKSKEMPDTGLGLLGAGVLGIGLLFLLALVRRLRQTA